MYEPSTFQKCTENNIISYRKCGKLSENACDTTKFQDHKQKERTRDINEEALTYSKYDLLPLEALFLQAL